MQFNKLRLAGFKSFVDPTELLIEPGMTGIVGPNGCGKSNLVDALKWVMGETSAKQLRGGEMDDVIFNGTANRPARNMAEVVLSLDNSERTVSAAYNDAPEIDVSRRIQREKGSTYRINAKEVRARDVHLLFADAMSGARSTALVSQGHIGAVVAAKPVERRKILEEAAGITGLYSRRHEAELRLRGAATNLERLDDVLVTLEAQMLSLKKQARQARRYRNLNEHIRRAEATMFLLRWTAASEELAAAEAAQAEAEKEVVGQTAITSRAATRQAEAADGLPQLREAEAVAAAALQRLAIERENLETEKERIAEAESDCAARLVQVAQDLAREQVLAADAVEALRALETEKSEIKEASESDEASMAEAAAKFEQARAESEKGEKRLADLMQKVAAEEARRADFQRRRDELEARLRRLADSASDLARKTAAIEAQLPGSDSLDEAERDRAAAEGAQAEMRAQADAAEAKRLETAEKLNTAHAQARQAAAAATKLDAEEQALTRLLDRGDSDLWPPLIDAVTVRPGFEAAFGAALGDDLTAATDEAAPIHWRTLPALDEAPPLPVPAEPLSVYVEGPAALNRRLSQIGVVDDEQTARRLVGALRQGQRLVSRQGALWRWDGFTVKAEAPTAAAQRLEQRNRLTEIADALVEVRRAARAAQELLDGARAASDVAVVAERDLRQPMRAAEAALHEARDRLAQLRQRAAESDSRLGALKEAAATVEVDDTETGNALAQLNDTEAAAPPAEEGRAQAEALRGEVAGLRTALIETQGAFDSLQRQAAARTGRLRVIDGDLASWNARRTAAIEKQEQLGARRRGLNEERQKLQDRPREVDRLRARLVEQLEGAEETRKQAADRLATAETALAEADRAWRAAEAALAQAREQRVRAEAAVAQARQAADGLGERIAERLESRPQSLREIAEIKEDAQLPDLEQAEKRTERLMRERDNMGPVNLRAEAESEELGEQIDTLNAERDDLLRAIEKLRRGINELNREGRARLLASFNEVNTHFQELFTRLFGGGSAHLTMIDADDPLEAGIEIMASPPGKKLQVLSLLSGGEQALTALALLFGVFLTNPAPICVLDEVDAPLDDANVDRFCSLVEEFAHSLSTRFLVITHHRMTMARVDRLFGVTMGEQGVSQLVSVDLRQAEQWRATA